MGFRDLFKGNPIGSLTDSIKSQIQSAQTSQQQQHISTLSPPSQTPDMSGPEFEPINGVSLEQYAELLAEMSDLGEAEAACVALAERRGVARADWEAAREGWTARMADAALENRVSHGFLKYYGPAMDRKRGGAEPISLEEYVRIFAETSFRKDPNDPAKQIDREVVLKENNLSSSKWNECLVYWSPKVSDASNPVYQKYSQLIDKEIKRIMSGV
jgi:hypothetical protein